MRCLVTGGAGFLGSHLCERLLNDGHEVLCLDNYFTGRLQNVSHLRDNRNFELIRHDVTEPILLEVDRIFNLACPASPVHYQFNPVKTIKTSVMGAINMLGLAKRVHARILQASTSEVYGEPQVHPQPETYRGNVSPIVRIFNTYGPRMLMNDGRVVSNFIVQALKGEDLTIYGDGTQTRSFCYVDDMVEAFVRMMDQDEIIGPVNVGNPGEFTMLELAHAVLDQTGSKSKIVHLPLPGDDPKMRRPDIALAKNTLGWEPKVNLYDGLQKTIEYFKTIV